MKREGDFNRSWVEYRFGFGGSSNFYIGHHMVTKITKAFPTELYAHMSGPMGTYDFYYDEFQIERDIHNFRLTVNGYHLLSNGE